MTLPEGNLELTFSYLGYETLHKRFTLTKDTLLNVQLTSSNQLAEVVILSDKQEAGIQSTSMGAHEIPMAQIRNTPTVLGEADLLKTIQLMPGVQAGVEGFSGLYVRGGGPDQNLILLDGIPVYNADHLLGVFSIFAPEAVKKVTLFKSSFPARYGGRLSSIVDVRTNDGNMKHYHGTISIGTLTSKLHFEGPIIKNRTAFSISARSTHTAFLSGIFKTDNESYNYYFYDLNAKVNHKFNDRSRVFLSFYHGKDHYHFNIDENYQYTAENENAYNLVYKDKNSLNWGNTIVAGRWNYVFSNKLFSNTTIAFNSYRMILNSNNHETRSSSVPYVYQYDSQYRSGIRDWSYRTDFDYTPVPSHHIKFGMEYLYHTFRPETTVSKIKETEGDKIEQDTLYHNLSNSHLKGHEVSLYAEDNFDIGSRLSINAGIHFSLFHTQGKTIFGTTPVIGALSTQPRIFRQGIILANGSICTFVIFYSTYHANRPLGAYHKEYTPDVFQSIFGRRILQRAHELGIFIGRLLQANAQCIGISGWCQLPRHFHQLGRKGRNGERPFNGHRVHGTENYRKDHRLDILYFIQIRPPIQGRHYQ